MKIENTTEMRVVVMVLLLVGLAQGACAENSYLRLKRDKEGKPASFQTSITRLKEPGGAYVDLVAVTHVADQAFYEKLNRHFPRYDSVLYEMILDVPRSVQHQNDLRSMFGYKKRRPVIDTSKGGRDANSEFQRFLGKTLGLSFQLEHVNYSAANFHHADLTLEEYQEASAARNESPASILRDLAQSAGEDDPPEYKAIGKLPWIKILATGPSPQEQQVLKVGFAASFSQLGDGAANAQPSALINDRNTRALKILAQRVKIGEKKLAIFYGAAHMPDFVKRLKGDGWKVVSTSWMSAWDLRT